MIFLLFLTYLVLLLLLWRFAFWFPRNVPGVTRAAPLLIGHRGVRGERPENTLEAFEFAFEEGLDGIETDVQKTKDNVLILYHDFKIEDHVIANMTLEQLKALNEPFSLLDDFLDLAKAYSGTLLNLEIKSETLRSDGVEADLLKRVKAEGLLNRVIFSSFNPVSVLRLRLLEPRARVGLLYHPEMNRWLRNGFFAAWLHVDALHPYETQIDGNFLQKSRALNINVNTWTVNDPKRISSLYHENVNAIMGDSPSVLKQAAKR